MIESSGNFTDCRVEMNSASSGGAIKMAGCNVTFEGVDFSKNTARNVGGVMDSFVSNITITNCLFRRNHAANVGGCLHGFRTEYHTNMSTFEQNTAEGSGGAAAIRQAKLFDTGTKWQNNSARMGGAFNLEDEGYAQLTESILRGNNVSGDGAAIRIKHAHVFLENVMLINNTAFADGYGGSAIFGEHGYVDTDGAIFQNHTNAKGPVMMLKNTTTRLKSSLFRWNVAAELGGCIYVDNSALDMENTTFSENKANKGGALFITNSFTEEDEEDINFQPRYITIRESVFDSNVALDAGGAMEISTAANVSTMGSVFLKNNASDFGGGIHMESSNVTIIATKFQENNARFGAAVEGYLSEFKVWEEAL